MNSKGLTVLTQFLRIHPHFSFRLLKDFCSSKRPNNSILEANSQANNRDVSPSNVNFEHFDFESNPGRENEIPFTAILIFNWFSPWNYFADLFLFRRSLVSSGSLLSHIFDIFVLSRVILLCLVKLRKSEIDSAKT